MEVYENEIWESFNRLAISVVHGPLLLQSYFSWGVNQYLKFLDGLFV